MFPLGFSWVFFPLPSPTFARSQSRTSSSAADQHSSLRLYLPAPGFLCIPEERDRRIYIMILNRALGALAAQRQVSQPASQLACKT